MSSEIPDSDKVQLLFKEFTGVTNVKQSTAFPGENFAFTDYIFGNRVFNEDIPTNLPSGLQSIDLDSCGNIIDGDFIDLPEYKLRFYKKLKLDPAEPGSLKSWYISDGSGGSILKDAIPFKYDPVNSSYRQFCYRRTSVGPPATYFQIQQYSNPTFWLFDYKSGFLEFYGDEATLTPYFTATDGPHFSFFKYIGEKGAAGGGGDASGNLDLSGNLTVVGDASFCNVLVRCDLDVSGNTDMSGNLTVVKDVTFNKNIIANYSGSNTNLIQSENFVLPAPILSPTNPNNEETSIIAQVNPSSSTPNEPFNATGYFTIEINSGTNPSNYFKAHFIAGIINDSQSNNPPGFNYYSFIKVLSVERGLFGFGINNPGILNIKLFKSVGTEMVYLALTYSSISSIPIRIRLYKNSENIIGENNHLSWVLRSQLIDPTDVLMKNIYIGPGPDIPVPPATSPQNPLHPVEPFTTTTQYNIIDNSMNIYGNLYNTGNLRVDGDTQLQDTDICGNLYVDRDASFNQSVHIRDTLDVSNNTNIQNDLTVGGKIIGDLDISGNLDVSGVITTVGNTTLVEYKHYGNTDFLTTNSNTTPDLLSENWCTIAYSNASNESRSSGLFQIIDKTDGVDQLMWFIVTKNEGIKNSYSINVISNSWSPDSQNTPSTVLANPPFIRKIKIVETGSGSTNKFYIQLDRVAYAASAPTDVDIRLYNNTYGINEGSDATTPWILDSTPPTSPSDVLTINLKEGVLDPASSTSVSTTRTNVVTNAFNYIIGGAKIGNTLDMSNNNINNVNQINGSNNNINFNNSGNLKLNSNNILKFGTNGSTNDISYNNDILDFQSTNKIENLSNINLTGGDITIGNPSNNVSLNANDINMTTGNNINITFADGKTMFVDSSYTLGGYNPIELSENKLNLRTTNLEVRTITQTTKDFLSNPGVKIDICGNEYEFTKTELDFNGKNIQELSNLNTTGTNLTVGTSNNRVNFESMTNMFKDISSNVDSKLTTNGDLAICTQPDSQKGIVFAAPEALGTGTTKYQVTTGTAINHIFYNLPLTGSKITVPGGQSKYFWSRYFGHPNGVPIGNDLVSVAPTDGYPIPFNGSLDAAIISGFNNSLKWDSTTGGSTQHDVNLSIGIWADNTPNVTWLIENVQFSGAVGSGNTIINLNECVFTKDYTMIKTGTQLTGSPSTTPTNWYDVNGEPIKFTTQIPGRIGLVIKIDNNFSTLDQTLFWEYATIGAQTFLKLNVPWNIN